MDKKRILICDIDGVICDSTVRNLRYIDSSALACGDYARYRSSVEKYNRADVDEDTLITIGFELICGLWDQFLIDEIFFITSREEDSRENTLNWLRKNVDNQIQNESLIMHSLQDDIERFNHVAYKRSKAEDLLKQYNVIMALDDYLPICDMYHSLGIVTLHVKFPGIDCVASSGMELETSCAGVS